MARIEDDVFAGVVQTRFVTSHLSFARQQPVLVASLSMAGVQTDCFVQVLFVGRRVQTHLLPVCAQVAHFARRHCFSRNEQFRVHVGYVPSEGMALELLPELFSVTDVAEVALRVVEKE